MKTGLITLQLKFLSCCHGQRMCLWLWRSKLESFWDINQIYVFCTQMFIFLIRGLGRLKTFYSFIHIGRYKHFVLAWSNIHISEFFFHSHKYLSFGVSYLNNIYSQCGSLVLLWEHHFSMSLIIFLRPLFYIVLNETLLDEMSQCGKVLTW